jgi:hypothetical protein
MSDKMKIDVAMANLTAGKFSFQMVEAIQEHVARLERQIEVSQACHAEAIWDLKRQEYANWRLETETRKLNAKIHALIRANALTEVVCRESASLWAKLAEYAAVSAEVARKGLEQAAADIKSGKTQADLARAAASLQALVREHAPTEQAVREMTSRIEPYLEAVKKRVGPSLEKTAAYVSHLKKTAA